MEGPKQNDFSEQPDFPIPLGWIRIFAAASCIISICGLVAVSWAETPEEKKGFEPGQRVFTNPFAPGAQGKPTPFFEDDEEDMEEEEDFEEFVPPPVRSSTRNQQKPETKRTNPSQPSPAADDSPTVEPKITSKGISVGGSPAGGVIQHNQVSPLRIDDETAEGSREIVTDFNFPDADIMDIAKTLGKLTGKNFILDKDVKGKITIISNSAITVTDAWKAFLTALDINGFALIPSGKYIRIARQRDARDKQLKTYAGDYAPDTDALITRIFPLKYLSADEVARNFRSFMPANARIIPYDQTNTVIVTDTGSNITKLSRLLEILDVEGYDAGIEVIPVKYASAVELSKLIDTLVPGRTTAPTGPRFAGAARFTARRTKEGGIINTIIADERTNTLIVHANSKGADQVRELVAKLDQKLPATTGGGKVHVVYLQFAESEAIANTLNNLSQTTSARQTSTGTGINPVQSSLFEGSIKVSPDKATNSLVITASPSDFVTVQRVINKLDIPRDEVYVEAVIMEMALERNFDFSTNVALPTSTNSSILFTPNQDLAQFLTSPLTQKGAILGFASGGEREVTINNQKIKISSVQGLIKALQTNSQANVLATPQILTLDNTEATFETAEKVPVPTTTAVQGAVSTSITKESVSLMIKIKPQINKISNFVKLDVQAKLEDFSGREPPAQVAGLAVSTVSRTAQTSVVVADSDTVVLGGLMRDATSETVSKIPFLGDIPLLGWLFRAKASRTQKTNLLIFLTPHIVRQYEKVRALLDKKLKERDDFIESAAGGNDPVRKQRDEMIRSLPDINEITSRKVVKTVTIDEEDAAPVPIDPSLPFTGGRETPKPPVAEENPSPEQSDSPLDSQPQAPVVPEAGGSN